MTRYKIYKFLNIFIGYSFERNASTNNKRKRSTSDRDNDRQTQQRLTTSENPINTFKRTCIFLLYYKYVVLYFDSWGYHRPVSKSTCQ
jgi:hypothetical protein